MEPRVDQLPYVVERSLYQDAIDRYIECSRGYIEALYSFGTVKQPGLSDLDLLVVPKRRYLAPACVRLMHRLDPRFDSIIEHEVFVVPDLHVRICAYRQPKRFSLIYGQDLLAGVAADDSVTRRLCDTVEGMHNLLVFLERVRAEQLIRARSCMRVFYGLRYTLKRAADLGLVQENGYGATMDELRARFVASPSVPCVLRMYHAYEDAVTATVEGLKQRLGIDVQSVAHVAAVVQGQIALPFDGFEMGQARARAAEITAYSQELMRRNYWYGYMFLSRLYPQLTPNSPFDRAVFRAVRFGLRRLNRSRHHWSAISGIEPNPAVARRTA